MDADLRSRLLEQPPQFHCWDGVWNLGGFSPSILQDIERALLSLDRPLADLTAYETGAGLSSAWFLALGIRVHSFCLDAEVVERVTAYLANYPELSERWARHVGQSEITLPQHILAQDGACADFCLIDGGHALQTVFTDFVYLNYALRQGGILVLDDLHLGSCRLLLEMLTINDWHFKVVSQNAKMAFLTKVTDKRFMPDWGAQKALLERLSASFAT